MATQDQVCSIVPYFQIYPGKEDAFREICERFIDQTREESGCLYYGFSFDGDKVHCREAYKNADGLLAHLDNVGALIGEALTISDITRLEVHGTREELEKLHEPLKDLNPEYWYLEYGFRN
ncbi:MAG: hypothetical protein HKN00_13745 [Flavobacteriaceae bacterium]|nr:antibiotic biosynthesis monooxygenase [Bacteroidia bacterium]MBT8289008.1 antibiotic biosynthesis monooxygenase [Bacteroidia bacterium]NNF76243.1 hypothetical protein [Flavobacteriaceae bacterium]NNK73441.1 hypothetical protein [Flavobacteriaceae bacterium]